MNEYEAQRLGYHYCGPTISKWDNEAEQENWKEDLAKAKEIKKQYQGADYVIAHGTKGSWLGSTTNKGLFGNEVFNKVWDLLRYHNLEKLLDGFDAQRQQAKEKYEAELNLINKREQLIKDDIAWLESKKIKNI